MKLSLTGFVKKWADRFADNDNFIISARDLREFSVDVTDTFGVTVANVPYYVAGTTYTVGYLVRYLPTGGQEGFYYALNPGKLTAPGPGNLIDWKVVPGPIEPTALSQSLTLVQAQGLDRTDVVAGRAYLIDCGPNAQGDVQVVTVRGVSNECFDVEGTLEVAGVRIAITEFNVQAGTWKVKTGYTDQQARAAQLNRAAPTGTTVYLDSAERADDYGTVASGKLTIDATACKKGVRVGFTVGVGAGKPEFINVPGTRPVKYVPADIYVAGTEFNYSVLVCLEKIEVAIYAS